MNDDLNDKQLKKIENLKREYTLKFYGAACMYSLTSTLIVTRDLFGLLPGELYGFFLWNPGTYIILFIFNKYLSDLSFDISIAMTNSEE